MLAPSFVRSSCRVVLTMRNVYFSSSFRVIHCIFGHTTKGAFFFLSRGGFEKWGELWEPQRRIEKRMFVFLWRVFREMRARTRCTHAGYLGWWTSASLRGERGEGAKILCTFSHGRMSSSLVFPWYTSCNRGFLCRAANGQYGPQSKSLEQIFREFCFTLLSRPFIRVPENSLDLLQLSLFDFQGPLSGTIKSRLAYNFCVVDDQSQWNK